MKEKHQQKKDKYFNKLNAMQKQEKNQAYLEMKRAPTTMLTHTHLHIMHPLAKNHHLYLHYALQEQVAIVAVFFLQFFLRCNNISHTFCLTSV